MLVVPRGRSGDGKYVDIFSFWSQSNSSVSDSYRPTATAVYKVLLRGFFERRGEGGGGDSFSYHVTDTLRSKRESSPGRAAPFSSVLAQSGSLSDFFPFPEWYPGRAVPCSSVLAHSGSLSNFFPFPEWYCLPQACTCCHAMPCHA